MTRRLELLDLAKAGLADQPRVIRVGRHLRVGGENVDAGIAQRGPQQYQSVDGLARLSDRNRAPRDVGTEAAEEGPRPEEHERGGAAREHGVTSDPATGFTVVRPRQRLVHMPAGDVDRV